MDASRDEKPRVLAVMAHPDDAEFLVGGSLFHMKASGCEVGIVTMTAGDLGSVTHSRQEIASIRLGEARAAADLLGAWYGCAGLGDMAIFASAETVRAVVELMRAFDPDVVLTHSPIDYLVDHEEASRITRAAAFAIAMPLYETGRENPAPCARATPALYYADPVEGIDAAGRRILPQFYVDISGQIENKKTMLSCHASQREWLRAHHGIDEYILQMIGWAERYGAECGCSHAEGFRQHLGHGYPSEPRLQKILGGLVKSATSI